MRTYFIRGAAKWLRHGPVVRYVFMVLIMFVAVTVLLLQAGHLFQGGIKALYPRDLPSEDLNSIYWALREKKNGDIWGMKCVHPKLNPYDPAVMQYYTKEKAVDCSSAMENWVYVNNGTFRISRNATRLYGKITCEYAPILRRDDFSTYHAPHVKPMLDGMPLQSDFFKVACVSSNGQKYMNVHSAVAWNSAVRKRLRDYHSQAKSSPVRSPPSAGSAKRDHPLFHTPQSLNLSVFMFGFDSLSRMAWLRLLPKTRSYFLETLGGMELESYNILGDGTPAALLPILTGKMEEELPEARRGFPGARPVDGHPWIWREFSKHGYVTAHAEDMPGVGTFQLRMLGFNDQPTDHHMRSFYLSAERTFKNNQPLCLGSRPRHINFMNWFGSLFDMYRGFPKFFFGFHSEMSHDHNNKVQTLDDDLVAFLKELEKKGHLNSTLLILMADHGARYDYIRSTAQGKLEERMPYFSFRFPPWFHKQYPNIIKNMEINSKRLTTPFDIYATFLDMLNYSPTNVGDLRNRGISLFKEVPKERTCTHAEITPHWCACLEWQHVNQSDPLVVQAVQSAIKTINSFTKTKRTKCAELTLFEITRSVRYVPSLDDRAAEWKLVSYQHSNYREKSQGGFSSPHSVEIFQVTFKTQPGLAHFEATCTRDMKSGNFRVSAKEISRINKYGSQPQCIQNSMPHLRPYCYCD